MNSTSMSESTGSIMVLKVWRRRTMSRGDGVANPEHETLSNPLHDTESNRVPASRRQHPKKSLQEHQTTAGIASTRIGATGTSPPSSVTWDRQSGARSERLCGRTTNCIFGRAHTHSTPTQISGRNRVRCPSNENQQNDHHAHASLSIAFAACAAWKTRSPSPVGANNLLGIPGS
jgi:hypothetical protein